MRHHRQQPSNNSGLTLNQRVQGSNYWGVVHGSLIAARHLRRKGGKINTGSVLSDRAMILQGPYSASKHAVKGFTDALRMELEI
jgi:NAD(P)-dependent dehydrogenase (short-subunit alcohol dehydrogenase family)